MDNKKTVLGINENLEAVLCYIFGWLSGLAFLVIERDNSFVRFHAMQAIATFISLSLLSLIVSYIPLIGLMINCILGPISIILWLWLMYKAYLGEKYMLPIIGPWAEKQLL